MARLGLASLGGSLCALSISPALGAGCPTPGEPDEIVRLIRNAPSCSAASGIAKNCAFGATGDIGINAAASEVCERDFLRDLGPKQRGEYRRRQADCDWKFRNESGSMFRSFASFCSAAVAKRYSDAALERRARR